VSNNAISPNGALNADKLTDVGGVYGQAPFNPNTDYAFSLFAKTNTATSIQLNFVDQSAGYLGGAITYTFATNVASVTGQSTNGSVTADKEDYGNGWIRVLLKFTTNTAQNYNYQQIDFQGGDGWIYGAQLEEQPYATSYIPTSGVIATRLADSVTGAGDASTFNSTEGVLYFEGSALADDGTNRFISLKNNTTVDIIRIGYITTSNRIEVQNYKAGTLFNTFNYEVQDVKANSKIAFKWKDNDFQLYINGLNVKSNTSVTAWGLGAFQSLQFNQHNGSNKFYGKVKDLRTYNTALTDAELITLTTI
jgi:hypothetical protein